MSLGTEDNDQTSTGAPDTDEWFSDNIDLGASQSSDEHLIDPLNDSNLISDDDGQVQLSAWFLFHDLCSLREYTQKTWANYVTRKLSLIAALIITTQAVEIPKGMGAVFFMWFDQRFEADRNYVSREGPLQRRKCGNAFNPNADRGAMSEERDAEDICLLMTHLPDVATQTIRSGSGNGEKCSNHTIDEESLVQGLCSLIDDPKRPIPIHLVFQWKAWKGIVLVNQTLQRSLDELRSITKSIVSPAPPTAGLFSIRAEPYVGDELYKSKAKRSRYQYLPAIWGRLFEGLFVRGGRLRVQFDGGYGFQFVQFSSNLGILISPKMWWSRFVEFMNWYKWGL
ncbi:hypothetical protein BD779DRAFT_1477406 [Infundibulicybe gibba]|nr:hypothetical protein BD779DRAFT_1477406 [Infundibulicybe gibba]